MRFGITSASSIITTSILIALEKYILSKRPGKGIFFIIIVISIVNSVIMSTIITTSMITALEKKY